VIKITAIQTEPAFDTAVQKLPAKEVGAKNER